MQSTTNPLDTFAMDAQADATTMEVQYLRPMLDQLPAPWRAAVDVGAHRGDVTAYLAAMGYRVLAVEPHPQMADRLEQRFAGPISRDAVRVARCAASERAVEDANFFVGSATTVNTLEEEWTTRGFPEHFGRRQTIRVPLRRVDDLVSDFTRERLGFLKVDVEGHEYPCLRGCFSRGSMIRPAVVMFEAFSRFPDAADQCLLYLARQGYGTFDIFVRVGQELTALERFRKPGLPEAWLERQGSLFYANVIAYHPAALDSIALPEPGAFFEQYGLAKALEVRVAA